MRRRIAFIVASLFACLASDAAAQNSAPSSHFVFNDDFDGDIIVNEIRVPKGGDTMYTYYEALGWRGKAAGYAGIQVHPKANLFIFSIWDHKSHSAPIRAVHRGGGTLTEGFGGEGTGLKSWNFEIGWKPDVWYTLVARCWNVGDHTHFGYWRRDGETGEWLHLVTMDVATKEARFRGRTDAFIEDWLDTGMNARTTNLRGGWKRKMDGAWFPFTGGRYSVNAWDLEAGKRSYARRTNWNGGVRRDAEGAYYFMTAGGDDTKPETENPSTHRIARQEIKPSLAPAKIVSAKAITKSTGDGDRVLLRWQMDRKSAPQFSYRASLSNGQKESLVDKPVPHLRELQLSGSAKFALLQVTDVFGNSTEVLKVPVDSEK